MQESVGDNNTALIFTVRSIIDASTLFTSDEYPGGSSYRNVKDAAEGTLAQFDNAVATIYGKTTVSGQSRFFVILYIVRLGVRRIRSARLDSCDNSKSSWVEVRGLLPKRIHEVDSQGETI